MGEQRLVQVNGVRLCVETFGAPGDPAILLIGGAGSSMDWWEDQFCSRLAAGLRLVIRYDSRDTGRSTSYPPGAPPYTAEDLAADAVGLLDRLAVDRAHLVGVSMGGAIAQRVAVEHADRVASLTLIATSPAGPGGPANPDLPPMSQALRAWFDQGRPTPDWTDRAQVIDYLVEGQRPFAGPHGLDEAHLRELAARIVDRTTDIQASLRNHWLVDGGSPVRPRLGEITAPALVIHGTADPLFPSGHAEALARELPAAGLLPLEGVGHQLPPPATWEVVIPAILAHTAGGWDAQGDRLAARSLAAGDPTGWFDRLYRAGAAGEVPMPWDRTHPHPLLAEWAQARQLAGTGKRAVVVGCGLGADAEYLAQRGYDTVAFDIADTAIRLARQRVPSSPVRYVTADLLDLPGDWWRAFDLVVEVITVQALPDPPRHQAIVNVGRLVAPGGTLLVIAAAQDGDDPVRPSQAPPWPLRRDEIDAFAADGLTPLWTELVTDPRSPGDRRWRAEFHRPRPDRGPDASMAHGPGDSTSPRPSA
jgi:pimeloyl-ACP methyl ester carboxylesterase/SAM-dependent methyltransferase